MEEVIRYFTDYINNSSSDYDSGIKGALCILSAGVLLDLGIRGYCPGCFGNSPGSLCLKKIKIQEIKYND